MKKTYSRSASLICPTCGGSEFLFKDDDSPVRCVGCDRVFARDELLRENGTQVESAVDGVSAQIVADVTKELRKIVKKLK